MPPERPPERPTALRIMRTFNLDPDPWQVEVLEGNHPRLLLNCCRQAGKSTIVALLGLVEAVLVAGSKVLLVSRSHRQSTEVFRTVTDFYRRIGSPMLQRLTAEELQLSHGSRVVSLPCREETIRGYANVSLLIIDEAARVPDDLYRAVRPMLAVSNGRMICMSTPYGKRGFFYDAWSRGGPDWKRIEVPAERVPRIKPEFLAQERRALGAGWFNQEYCCSFESLSGLVYPDFARCVVAQAPPHLPDPRTLPRGKRVGGIDFGFRNPFAAVWGMLDRDGILWLTGEHYCRNQPLNYHIQHLPRDAMWHADPSGASDISGLRASGLLVRQANNAIRPGLAAVTARLNTGLLHVVAGACPNLLAEAELYRYSDEPGERESENPLDDHNHALDALRYLVLGIDGRRPLRPPPPPPDAKPPDAPAQQEPPKKNPWLRYDNEALWTRLF